MNKPDKQLKYIAYVRKSEEREEAQQLSLSAQKREIKERFPDLKIVKFVEETKSAFEPHNRPVFTQLLHDIEEGKADGIVAYHPNRMSRNSVDAGAIVYALQSKHSNFKDLMFVNYGFQNNPEGIMMLQMVLSQSQYESAKQSVDVARGNKQKIIEQGERPGVVPQGYMKADKYDDDGKVIKNKKGNVTHTVPDPDRYDLIEKAWRMLLSGAYNVPQIRKQLTTWGYRTTQGNKLGSSSAYRIFSNPFYAGKIKHNDELYEGKHQAMLTWTEFELAQHLLGDRGFKVTENNYAYTGFIKCGECGCSIVAKQVNKVLRSDLSLKKFQYYHCTRKSEKRSCTQTKYTSNLNLEKQIDQHLGSITILPEFKDLAIKILKRNNKVEVKDRNTILKQQNKRRDEIQKQSDKLLDLLLQEKIKQEVYESKQNRFRDELASIDKRLDTTKVRADGWMRLVEDAFDFATHAQVNFANGDNDTRRSIVMNMGANFILKDNELELELKPWLTTIKEDYPSLERTYLKARTNKKTILTDEEPLFAPIIEQWRAIWDSNPGHRD